MMTEGHDKAARAEFNKASQAELESKGYRIELTEFDDGSIGYDIFDPTGKPAGYVDFGTDYLGTDPVVKSAIQNNIRPSQEGGMRLAYDTTLPSIMSKLVGEGQMEDFGVHKNALKADSIPSDAVNRMRAEGRSDQEIQDILGNLRLQGSPVFRNPDGTPKTNVTARVYDISNTSPRADTLFAQDQGRVYGAASYKAKQILLNSKAFQGLKASDRAAFVFAHEQSHISFAKAIEGNYGPQVKILA